MNSACGHRKLADLRPNSGSVGSAKGEPLPRIGIPGTFERATRRHDRLLPLSWWLLVASPAASTNLPLRTIRNLNGAEASPVWNRRQVQVRADFSSGRNASVMVAYVDHTLARSAYLGSDLRADALAEAEHEGGLR